MKKQLCLTLSALALCSTAVFGQDKSMVAAGAMLSGKDIVTDTTKKNWTYGGAIGLNFGQAAFFNWAGGGINSISAQLNGSAFAHYQKKKFIWDNDFIGAWGIIGQGPFKNTATNPYPFRKNVDFFLRLFRSNKVEARNTHV